MMAEPARVRVMLPAHLRSIAKIEGEVVVSLTGPVTQRAILDALEQRYPMLRGTLRDHDGRKRRAFVRFFANQQDWSNEAPDAALPEEIAEAREPFIVLGAMAGG